MLAYHHGINHQRERKIAGQRRHRFDDRAIAQRSGFRGRRRNIADRGANLIGHQFRRQAFHALHAASVLHGDQGDHRFAIDAELMKCFEVGLNTGAAARIGPGDGQRDRLLRARQDLTFAF